MRNGGAAYKKQKRRGVQMRQFLKVSGERVSRLGVPNIVRLTANDKDFSLTLEMTIRGSLKAPSLLVFSCSRSLIPNP